MPSLAVAAAYGAHPRPSLHGAKGLVAGTILAASATSAVAVVRGDWVAPVDSAAFWVLAVLCLIGELLPIRLGRTQHCELITMSSAFAFAILLAFGILPAIAVYAAASLLADLAATTGLVKAAFNASQYALALAAAAAIVAILGHTAGLAFSPADLPAFVAGALAFAMVNHVLAGSAAAMMTGHPVPAYVAADLQFHLATAGVQLALAPLAVVAAQTQPALVPVLLLPLAGICWAGRRAVGKAHLAVTGTPGPATRATRRVPTRGTGAGETFAA